MIAAFRSGIGSLVDQWFGRSRVRTPPRLNLDRQGSRLHSRTRDADAHPRRDTHADVLMRRFAAYALGASLGDLRVEATNAGLAGLESAARARGDLELQAKYLPRRPSLLPQLMSALN